MSELSYLMLMEAIVFLFSAFGTVMLQNSVITVSSAGNPLPVCVTAVLANLMGCVIFLALALVLALNIDTNTSTEPSVENIVCSGLARGVRGAIGVILLCGIGMASLLYTNSDWEAWLSFYSGNQLVTSYLAWKYRLFATIMMGLIITSCMCLLLSVHRLLFRIRKATSDGNPQFLSRPPRFSWTVAMALTVLMEIQYMMHYNTVHTYAKRPVFVSISTIMAASSILLVDVIVIKIYAARSSHVTTFRILTVMLYLGTLCGFSLFVLLYPELHSEDSKTVNYGLLAILFIANILDIYVFFHSGALPQDKAQNTLNPKPSLAPSLESTTMAYQNIPTKKSGMTPSLIDQLITTGNRAHIITVNRDNLRPRTLKLKQKQQ